MELVKQFSPNFLISGTAPSQSQRDLDQPLDEAGQLMANLILDAAPRKTPFTADSMVGNLEKSWKTSAIEIAPVLQSMARAGKLFVVAKDVRGNPVYLVP